MPCARTSASRQQHALRGLEGRKFWIENIRQKQPLLRAVDTEARAPNGGLGTIALY